MNTRIFFLLSVPVFFFQACGFLGTEPLKSDCALINAPAGKIHAETAATPSSRTLGLMFRKELPADRGMIFVFEEDAERIFWMKNTVIPLDIIFLGADREIRKIFRGVPVYSKGMRDEDIPRVSGNARYVLELSSGAAVSYGLKEGASLKVRFMAGREACR